jgi:lipopolysaccharide export system protein LptC
MGRLRSGRLFPVALMLFLALATFWLQRFVQLPDWPGRGLKHHQADFTVEDFILTQINKAGAADTSLTATRMVHFADDESTELQSPRMTQNKAGDPPLEIVAQRGTVDKDGNVVQLIDDVVMTRAATADHPELQLKTSFIEINIHEEIGTTPEKVLITQGKSSLEGVGMVFRNQTREFELHSQVQGIYVKENPEHKQVPGPDVKEIP